VGLDGSDVELCEDKDDGFRMDDRPRRNIDDVLKYRDNSSKDLKRV